MASSKPYACSFMLKTTQSLPIMPCSYWQKRVSFDVKCPLNSESPQVSAILSQRHFLPHSAIMVSRRTEYGAQQPYFKEQRMAASIKKVQEEMKQLHHMLNDQ
ncbi:hypothetical protein HPP92_029133, partial [Vanilla planifolia]